jgi:hypothetical protein
LFQIVVLQVRGQIGHASSENSRKLLTRAFAQKGRNPHRVTWSPTDFRARLEVRITNETKKRRNKGCVKVSEGRGTRRRNEGRVGEGGRGRGGVRKEGRKACKEGWKHDRKEGRTKEETKKEGSMEMWKGKRELTNGGKKECRQRKKRLTLGHWLHSLD